ncbi:MAG TPA: hypothetical protein VGF85_03595 [Opitutaceae bacterium]|jgi:hypothetical protein
MTIEEAIQNHRAICDDLYGLAVEENRFLQEQHRPAEPALIERRRAVLKRLDEAVTALRSLPAGGVKDPGRRDALEKTQARIMQILQIDRENEQLLTRYSLSRGTPPPSAAVDRGILQRIYSGGT